MRFFFVCNQNYGTIILFKWFGAKMSSKFLIQTIQRQCCKTIILWTRKIQLYYIFLCNSITVDSWLHILVNYKQKNICALNVKQYKRVIWKIREFLTFNSTIYIYILWIFESPITIFQKTNSLFVYYGGYVEIKDAVIMQDSNMASFA